MSPSMFEIMVLSLGNAALMGLGLMPEPETGEVTKNLELAEYNVELLAMLQEKCKGNLTEEESNLLNGLLYDLRLKYVEARQQL